MAGRPSKYKPAMIPELLELSKEGKLIVEIAAHFKVTYHTLLNWSKSNQEFKEAYEVAKTYIKAWWINKARESLYDKDFSSTLWSMLVQSIGITTRARTVELLSLQDEKKICTQNAPQIAKLLVKECACGNLSPQEAVNLINALGNVVKMEEAVILKERVEEIEKLTQSSD